MKNALGLVELLLVLLGAMGWGAYELWTLRRDRKRSGAAPEPTKRSPP